MKRVWGTVWTGMLLLTVALGGTLVQHVPDLPAARAHKHGPGEFASHTVRTVAGSRVAAALGSEALVSCYHHQAVERLGSGLVVEAISVPDRVVEAIRATGPGYVAGVQWHPEFHDPENGQLLDGGPLLHDFLGFADAARTGVAHRPPEPVASS